ncbi:hypothetical protein JOQ06_026386, partial [Pogonophryne albipinna]
CGDEFGGGKAEEKEEIKASKGRYYSPLLANLTFYTKESILRLNTLSTFSFCITLPLTSPPL